MDHLEAGRGCTRGADCKARGAPQPFARLLLRYSQRLPCPPETLEYFTNLVKAHVASLPMDPSESPENHPRRALASHGAPHTLRV